MFETITRIIILALIVFLLYQVLTRFIPRPILTWLGGLVLVLALVFAVLEPANRLVLVLWQIISFPLKPVGLVLVLLGYALRRGVKAVDSTLVLTAFLVLLVFSLPVTAYLLTGRAEQQAVLEAANRQAAALNNVDAIVVLGDNIGTVTPLYRNQLLLTNASQGLSSPMISRLFYAAQRYQQQVARGNDPIIILSPGAQPELRREDMVDLLAQFGVPRDRVSLDNQGFTIRRSAEAVRQLLNVAGTPRRQNIILVSPVVNVRRAASTFANLGFTVVPSPPDFLASPLQGQIDVNALTALVPSAEALVISSQVIEEYLGTLYYFLRDWLVDPLAV